MSPAYPLNPSLLAYRLAYCSERNGGKCKQERCSDQLPPLPHLAQGATKGCSISTPVMASSTLLVSTLHVLPSPSQITGKGRTIDCHSSQHTRTPRNAWDNGISANKTTSHSRWQQRSTDSFWQEQRHGKLATFAGDATLGKTTEKITSQDALVYVQLRLEANAREIIQPSDRDWRENHKTSNGLPPHSH